MNSYEPAMLPIWDRQLAKARATARFEGGRGTELLIHASITI